jgi:hypothetical protein
MEISIKIDMESIIRQAVSTERIQPLVDKAIMEAMKSAIEDATNWKSDFRKSLEKQLVEYMPRGLSIESCAKFQLMLNTAITNVVQGENAAAIQTALRGVTDSIIGVSPASAKLSEIVKLAREAFHTEEHESFYAKLESREYGGILYLDSSSSLRNQYSASTRISFNKSGVVYALKMDGRDVTPKSAPAAIGSFDGLLLSMYVGRTTIEIDCDEDDVESAAGSQVD